MVVVAIFIGSAMFGLSIGTIAYGLYYSGMFASVFVHEFSEHKKQASVTEIDFRKQTAVDDVIEEVTADIGAAATAAEATAESSASEFEVVKE